MTTARTDKRPSGVGRLPGVPTPDARDETRQEGARAVLRFDIHHDDIPGTWHWQDSGWHSGSSWVTPVPSPALHAESLRTDQGVTIVVRETRPGGDFVELTLGADGTMWLVAGPIGVAPLYVTAADPRLIGSWETALAMSRPRTDSCHGMANRFAC